MAVTDTDARDNRLTFVICQTFVMGLLINMQFCMYASLLVHVGAVRGSAVRDDLDEHSEDAVVGMLGVEEEEGVVNVAVCSTQGCGVF